MERFSRKAHWKEGWWPQAHSSQPAELLLSQPGRQEGWSTSKASLTTMLSVQSEKLRDPSEVEVGASPPPVNGPRPQASLLTLPHCAAEPRRYTSETSNDRELINRGCQLPCYEIHHHACTKAMLASVLWAAPSHWLSAAEILGHLVLGDMWPLWWPPLAPGLPDSPSQTCITLQEI